MRRFFQFRISTVLLFVALCAVGLGWWRDHQDLRHALFLLISAPSDDGEISADVERRVEAVLQAKQPSHAEGAYRALFKAAGTAGLSNLKLYRHDSIAIQAAWEEVELTVPEMEGPTVFRPDKDKLGQFLGFLEGRARVKVPKWWEQMVLDARANRRRNIYRGQPEEPPYHDAGMDHLWAPKNTTLRREDDKVVLRVDAEFVTVPEELLKRERNISALIRPDRYYLVEHGNWGHPSELICIDRASSKILWKAEVWGTRWGSVSGQSQEWVAVTEQNNRVVVFGASGGVNVEAFNADDGTNLFRFSSSY
jgi:hypothetical protein